MVRYGCSAIVVLRRVWSTSILARVYFHNTNNTTHNTTHNTHKGSDEGDERDEMMTMVVGLIR
jgi:hypothetical protein